MIRLDIVLKFFSYDVFVWLWYQGNNGLIEEVGSLPPPQLSEEFVIYYYYFFFKYLIKFISDAIWAMRFFVEFFYS